MIFHLCLSQVEVKPAVNWPWMSIECSAEVRLFIHTEAGQHCEQIRVTWTYKYTQTRTTYLDMKIENIEDKQKPC